MPSDEYPYLRELTVPDRLRLAAYVAGDHGVPAIYLRAILGAASQLEGLRVWEAELPTDRASRRASARSSHP